MITVANVVQLQFNFNVVLELQTKLEL